MSISMERFAAQGLFPTFDPYQQDSAGPQMFGVLCRRCGYEPEDRLVLPRRCPKCGGESFERFPLPGALLAQAIRGQKYTDILSET